MRAVRPSTGGFEKVSLFYLENAKRMVIRCYDIDLLLDHTASLSNDVDQRPNSIKSELWNS